MKPLKREGRSRSSGSGLAPRTVSFECSAELLRDFERRAFEQGCSVDWLMEEAMQRLLADEVSEPRRSAAPASTPPASAQHVKPRASLPPAPLPAPPDSLQATLPPPPVRATRSTTVSIPTPPPPSVAPASVAPASVAPASVAPVSVAPASGTPAPARPLASRVAVTAPLVLDYGGATVSVDRAPFVLGRSPQSTDFVIDDGAVSRRHAVIERQANGWVITDLGSTNGIIVDGNVVRHAVLRVGTVMTIGPLTFGVVSA